MLIDVVPLRRSRRGPPIDEAYRGVRALVLGGTGFIGAWTVRALHAHGAVVSVVARDAARAAAALGTARRDARVVVADLREPTAPERAIDETAPAVVFNLAGYGVHPSERNPDLMAALNVDLVERVCAKLAAEPDRGWPGLRLVHAGSALEYGPVDGPLRENAVVDPTTDYGRTKLRGTRIVESCGAMSGLRGAVARLFTVYGPGEHDGRLLPSLMRAARTGQPLELTSGRQRRNFTYVEDVVEGLLRLAVSAAGPGEIVNLATDRLTSVREFAETAARVLGMDRALLAFGALPHRDDEMWHGEVDVTRLRRLASWVPQTPIADGVRRTWEMTDGL